MPGSSAYGQGGLANALPGRGLPEYSRDGVRIGAPAWGGAHGPAALPSRTIAPSGPAPAEPLIGWHGPISCHRGAFVEDAAAPRLVFDGVGWHRSIPWRRPVYANVAGRLTYRPPTQMPSWTADAAVVPSGARAPIPVQNKKIGNYTVRRPYGNSSTGMLFSGKSNAEFVAEIQAGMDVQGRRWLKGAKTANPWVKPLSAWGPAGSYGSSTPTLPTAPGAQVQAAFNQYGAY
jgi:hypothetical protein